MPLKMDNMVCGRCSTSQIIQFTKCLFLQNTYICCHLKLEIAIAIPASNDDKYNIVEPAMSSHSYEQPTSYGRPLGHSPKWHFVFKCTSYEQPPAFKGHFSCVESVAATDSTVQLIQQDKGQPLEH